MFVYVSHHVRALLCGIVCMRVIVRASLCVLVSSVCVCFMHLSSLSSSHICCFRIRPMQSRIHRYPEGEDRERVLTSLDSRDISMGGCTWCAARQLRRGAVRMV